MKVSPLTAPAVAESSVEFVHKKFGFSLPYTPESLLVVDAIVEKIKATGATEQQASGLLAGLGCYVGEVFVRHARATWRSAAEMGMTKSCLYPVVVALPPLNACDVIGQVFRRFNGGPSEGLALFYETTIAAAVPCPGTPDHNRVQLTASARARNRGAGG